MELFQIFDNKRNRTIPIAFFEPTNKAKTSVPVIIFNPGYQKQKDLNNDTKWAYQKFMYLAKFFNEHGYAFISIQHDMPGDIDGLETLDKSSSPYEARKHLYIRGQENIVFTISSLKTKYPHLDWSKCILSGHSHGADIAKYYSNAYTANIINLILFDGRRVPLVPQSGLRLLMFEASDTSTDQGVIPNEGTQSNPKRINLEWFIFKPYGAMHNDYEDTIPESLKHKVLTTIKWFLSI